MLFEEQSLHTGIARQKKQVSTFLTSTTALRYRGKKEHNGAWGCTGIRACRTMRICYYLRDKTGHETKLDMIGPMTYGDAVFK